MQSGEEGTPLNLKEVKTTAAYPQKQGKLQNYPNLVGFSFRKEGKVRDGKNVVIVEQKSGS